MTEKDVLKVMAEINEGFFTDEFRVILARLLKPLGLLADMLREQEEPYHWLLPHRDPLENLSGILLGPGFWERGYEATQVLWRSYKGGVPMSRSYWKSALGTFR